MIISKKSNLKHWFKFTFGEDYLFKKSVRRFFFILSLKLWTVILDISDRVGISSDQGYSKLWKPCIKKNTSELELKELKSLNELNEFKVGRIVTFSVDLAHFLHF
jgi:hypothetical protein